MCMTTKVYNLNQQEEYWAEELRPSVRKLRSAMQTLDRIARVTYGLLSLKEPSHTASLSYSVRYRYGIQVHLFRVFYTPPVILNFPLVKDVGLCVCTSSLATFDSLYTNT